MNEKQDDDGPVTFELSDDELEQLSAQRSEVVRNVMVVGKTPYTIENAPVSKMLRPRAFRPARPIK